jgi:uncharacterized protein
VSEASARIYQYFVDREGDWWCEGWPVDDPDLRDQLSRSLHTDGGRLFLRCDGEVHPVAVEITPLFVRDVEPVTGADGTLEAVAVRLRDGRRQPLRADTLRVDGEQRLYCDAGDPPLPAMFFRPAFYRLMRYLDEDDGRYYVRIAGHEWTIRQAEGPALEE